MCNMYISMTLGLKISSSLNPKYSLLYIHPKKVGKGRVIAQWRIQDLARALTPNTATFYQIYMSK